MKPGVTVDQVRAAKRKAQADIQDILVRLCSETGLVVERVELQRTRYEMCGGESQDLIQVSIRLEVL